MLMQRDIEGWPSLRPLRPALLAPRELQPITAHDVRRRSGADAVDRRSEPSIGGGKRGRYHHH